MPCSYELIEEFPQRNFPRSPVFVMNPAPALKRLLAAIIDCVIAIVLGLAPMIGVPLSISYVIFRDGMCIKGFGGRSVGKFAMNLRVVDLVGSGSRQSPFDSLKRNCLLWIPLMPVVEGFVVVIDERGQRLGDRMAGTMVVEHLGSRCEVP